MHSPEELSKKVFWGLIEENSREIAEIVSLETAKGLKKDFEKEFPKELAKEHYKL